MFETRLQTFTEFMIRPRRRSYYEQDLGPTLFKEGSSIYSRIDFLAPFQYFQTYGYPHTTPHSPPSSEMQLHCSIFQLEHCTNKKINAQERHKNTCIITMHGNTGSRMSTVSNLRPAIQAGCSLVIFDFIGCGNSDGHYVTLGHHEKHQISAVMHYVHLKYQYSRFILYGRSMGAASALLYSTDLYPLYSSFRQKRILDYLRTAGSLETSKDIIMDIIAKMDAGFFGYEVIGAILDSPYSDASKMITDAVNRKAWFIPTFALKYVFQIVQRRALEELKQSGLWNSNSDDKNAEGNWLGLIRIPNQPLIPFPVYVLYGLQDNLISQAHTWQTFKSIQCNFKKLHVMEDQGHGGHRADSIKLQAIEWILQTYRFSKKIDLQEDEKNLGIPISRQNQHSEQKGQNIQKLIQSKKTQKVGKTPSYFQEKQEYVSSMMPINTQQLLGQSMNQYSQIKQFPSSVQTKAQDQMLSPNATTRQEYLILQISRVSPYRKLKANFEFQQ